MTFDELLSQVLELLQRDGRVSYRVLKCRFDLNNDYLGIGLPFLHQGAVHQALPRLERAVGICQDAKLPLYFPVAAAGLGSTYALAQKGQRVDGNRGTPVRREKSLRAP